MARKLDGQVLNQLFLTARSHTSWLDRPVTDAQIHDLYELLKWGPTSANSCPGRFVWVRTDTGRQKLSALASDGNKAKILAAPVTVIIGHDENFADTIPQLLPGRGDAMRDMFRANPSMTQASAFRNGSLQGAYLILAARALGLDCGPMSGFDNEAVDKEFFAGTQIKSNFICSLGYGSGTHLHPRNPRLSFEDAGHFA
jgi:3-hydroxypropanoate dehydrogenase